MLPESHKKVIYIYFPIHGKGWAVKKEGAQRAIRCFDSKISAVAFAADFTKKGFDVFVHDIYGRVEEWLKAKTAA